MAAPLDAPDRLRSAATELSTRLSKGTIVLLVGLALGVVLSKLYDNYRGETATFRASSSALAQLLAQRIELERARGTLKPDEKRSDAAKLDQDVELLSAHLAALRVSVRTACATDESAAGASTSAFKPAGPTKPRTTPRRSASSSSTAYSTDTSARPTPEGRRSVHAAFDPLFATFWAIVEQHPAAHGTSGAVDRHTPLIESAKARITSATTLLDVYGGTLGNVWRCIDIEKDPTLRAAATGPAGSDVLIRGFRELASAVRASADREAAQLTSIDVELNLLDASIQQAQRNLEIAPAHTVVSQMPFAMLIIVAFGVGYFFVSQIGDGKVVHELVRSGQLVQFPTVVILFAVILVLALAKALEPNQTGTLVAGVAGYVLSQGIGRLAIEKRRRDADDARSDRAGRSETPPVTDPSAGDTTIAPEAEPAREQP